MRPTKTLAKVLLSILALTIFLGKSSPDIARADSRGDQANPQSTLQAIQQPDNYVFAIIGDYGIANQYATGVANLVKSWNPAFIVTVGDNNYPLGAASSIDENIGQFYHDYIYLYNGRYGPGSDINRFFPALGNHDWMTNSARPYLNYFTLPGNERYYEFVQGSVHFFVIDSDPSEPDGISSNSTQAKWLKNSLASSTSPFDLVIMHHPPYSSGSHGSTGYMQWPFKEWGADAVFAGHDHLYERLLVNDFPYFVNGFGGSSPLYSFVYNLPGSQVKYNQDFGAVRVEVSNTFMNIQAITRTGSLIDEYMIGKIIPNVTSITASNPNPSNGTNVDFNVIFSEPVTGVDASDFNLVSSNILNSAITNVAGTGNAYVVSVSTGSGDGAIHLDLIDDDSIINNTGSSLGGIGVGNGSFFNGETYTIDRSAPSVGSIIRTSPSPTGASSVDFLVTFSEVVLGIDSSDFNLVTSNPSGAIVTNVFGAENAYTITVNTGLGDDLQQLNLIDDDSITDIAGNRLGGDGPGTGNFENGETYVIDKTLPVVTSIIRTGVDPTNSPSVDFIVTFSEPVTGVDAQDFILATSNLFGATITGVTNSDPFYIVSVNTGTGAGTIRLDLLDNDSIGDYAGNTLGGTGEGNGNFSNGEFFTINKTAPYVLSILRANPSPSNSSVVDFTVTFSEPVTGVDVSDFILTTVNISDASIVSVNGSGNIYSVSVYSGSGDGTFRLDLIDDDSILNGNLNNLGEAGAGNGNFIGETCTMDKTSPAVTSIIRASPNPSGAASVDFIVTFSESVSGVDASDFVLSTNGLWATSILGVKNVDPFYIVTVSTGAGTGLMRLDLLDDDSISDSAGNKLGGLNPGNGNFTSGEPFDIAKASINFPAPITRGPRRLSNNPAPTLYWTPVWGSQAYEIVIAADNKFARILTVLVTNTLSIKLNPPLGDGLYFWRVRAYNINLQPGRYSATLAFTLDSTPPPIPSLLNPAPNTQTNRKPLFQWASTSSAVNYHIEVDNNPDFSSPEFAILKQETSVRSAYLPRGIFFWHVRAKDEAGNWSSWSNPFSFTIP